MAYAGARLGKAEDKSAYDAKHCLKPCLFFLSPLKCRIRAMEAVLAGLNGEVVTECQTLQTAAFQCNCQYMGFDAVLLGFLCIFRFLC